jgi:hypothetical protein
MYYFRDLLSCNLMCVVIGVTSMERSAEAREIMSMYPLWTPLHLRFGTVDQVVALVRSLKDNYGWSMNDFLVFLKVPPKVHAKNKLRVMESALFAIQRFASVISLLPLIKAFGLYSFCRSFLTTVSVLTIKKFPRCGTS